MSAARAVSGKWVYAALVAFVTGFAAFWPRVFLVVDEDRYVSQAMAFARGSTQVAGSEILYPPSGMRMISDYPPGTALLQTPLVWMAGWRAAALVSVACLIVATVLTMRLLKDAGKPAAFALLIPGYLGAAFFGRVAMSDIPGTALVALGLLLLWRSERGAWTTSLGAGLCVGATLLFREPLMLILAPFAAGALARRRTVAWALIAGILVGVALRFSLSEALFGSPFYVRDSGYRFSVSNLAHTIPVYGVALLILLPGGALLPFLYRGPRRVEMLVATWLYVLLFLLYGYDPIRENGPLKGLILASRFVAPLLPLLALMAADVCLAWYSRLRIEHRRGTMLLAHGAAIAAVATALLVHPLAFTQERGALEIIRAIYSRTTPGAAVITNSNATLKYLSPAYGPRRLILRYGLNPDTAASLVRRLGPLDIVLLNRSDSESHRTEARDNVEFLEQLRRRCTLLATGALEIGGWAHLRTHHLSNCT